MKACSLMLAFHAAGDIAQSAVDVLEGVFEEFAEQESDAERVQVDDLDHHVFAGFAGCVVEEDEQEARREAVEAAVAYGLRLLIRWEAARRGGRGTCGDVDLGDQSAGDGGSLAGSVPQGPQA